jgi:hypothetical protein
MFPYVLSPLCSLKMMGDTDLMERNICEKMGAILQTLLGFECQATRHSSSHIIGCFILYQYQCLSGLWSRSQSLKEFWVELESSVGKNVLTATPTSI